MGLKRADVDEPTATPSEWIRNAADELAVRRGAKWDIGRAAHFIETVENHFRLYEGANYAGTLVRLMPYQLDFFTRLFAWVVWSDHYGRWLRRFRRASLWVPKKNGKSPSGAMVGNYLTTADGELGGKTFAVAKDGKQARIVHDHAIKMVEQSESLMESCRITLNPERRITHLSSMSFFGVLAGDNIEGQEGLNGNAIIDEGHVVSERLARTLRYMGATREEPLEMMLSTAGNNKRGWGGKRWDYGERVNRGDVEDIEFLHVCYAAPQDATDEQLLDRKMWRITNPALGFILDEERFGREVREAHSGSLQDWSECKKYRFNIWQATATPWLSMASWDACPADGELSTKEPCYGGLDLSSKQDFTAWVLAQRIDPGWILRCHFWLSEKQSRRHQDNGLPIYEWEKDGWLTICPGARIDYEMIADRIGSDSSTYDIEYVGHDPWNAEATRQALVREHNLEMIEITQTFRGISEFSKIFAAGISALEIDHGGDPVLRWMAENVTTTSDSHDNIKPVKPDRKELLAIDGIVASIMAIGVSMASPEPKKSIFASADFE